MGRKISDCKYYEMHSAVGWRADQLCVPQKPYLSLDAQELTFQPACHTHKAPCYGYSWLKPLLH